jgi:molybdate transport system substrate-binding protein
MKRCLTSLLALLLAVNTFGCNAAFKKKKELSIFVPCSIFAAFCEIMDAYKKDNPEVKISFDTGNTIVLMRKVLNKGARPDIYISTGPLEVEPLIEKGLVDAQTRVTLTSDSIILVTPAGNPKNIQQISDLTRPDIKGIAIPDPSTNSSGKFAVEALKKLNLWDKIKDKVVFTEFGRFTRNYITENKIDAGILYRSCLFEDLKAYDEVIAPKDMFVVADILKETGGEVPSSVCILKSSKNKKLAQEFINYMLSPKSKEILSKWKGKEIAPCKVYSK